MAHEHYSSTQYVMENNHLFKDLDHQLHEHRTIHESLENDVYDFGLSFIHAGSDTSLDFYFCFLSQTYFPMPLSCVDWNRQHGICFINNQLDQNPDVFIDDQRNA